MNRVHQGCAAPVLLIKLVQPVTREHEGRYLTIIEADAGQIAATGQQIGTQEDIRGLVVLDRDHLLVCVLAGDEVQEESLRHLMPWFGARQLRLAKEWKLMGFFVR